MDIDNAMEDFADGVLHADPSSEQALVEHAGDAEQPEHAGEGPVAGSGAADPDPDIMLIDDDDQQGDSVSETLLSVLAKNLAGTWFNSQRARHKVWSFFCPTDSKLSWEERGKAKELDCLICHAER
jgi:hypothetical protein